MISAMWYVQLVATCPNCQMRVDLTGEPDFWLDHDDSMVKAGLVLDVTCPECLHNFEVVTE